MKKAIVLTLGILLIGTASVLAWVYFVPQDRPPVTPEDERDPFGYDERQPATTSGTSAFPPPAGTSSSGALARIGTITLQALLADTETFPDPYNEGHYFLGFSVPAYGDPATNTPPYIIEFIVPGSSFNVSLLREPIGQARLEAERYLGAKLGMTPRELCTLNALVTVPTDVNEAFASIDLRFSSCPDTTFLP